MHKQILFKIIIVKVLIFYLIYIRIYFILLQNRIDTDSQPRKNNEKYLKDNNTFGKDLKIMIIHLQVLNYF